jgi:hypothetical protein
MLRTPSRGLNVRCPTTADPAFPATQSPTKNPWALTRRSGRACNLASPLRNLCGCLLILRPSAGHSAAKDFVQMANGGGMTKRGKPDD